MRGRAPHVLENLPEPDVVRHMPALRWTYGYPLVLGVIATACVVIHRGFRRNGWL
ncbi:hypothetical protein [Streptomyces sp. NPDC058548]|uniref:hypothetical protein n=1 Tax=Streptomyces sp. NPDC058548 TaxID=3346545 RepID=UPI0036656EDE